MNVGKNYWGLTRRRGRSSVSWAPVQPCGVLPRPVQVDPGSLYLVATPIGNFWDVSLRASAILQQVDWIAAEDTRYSRILLRRLDEIFVGNPELEKRVIAGKSSKLNASDDDSVPKLEGFGAIRKQEDGDMMTRQSDHEENSNENQIQDEKEIDRTRRQRKRVQVVSHHEHNWHQRVPELVERLALGDSVALISDAGTPGISDPGFELVRACRERQIPVIPVPGPCAAIAALSVSGLPPGSFTFLGFLPSKGRSRRDAIEKISKFSQSVVIYEAPHRLLRLLSELAEDSGVCDRPVVLARELTKRYEEFLRFGSVDEANRWVEATAYEPIGEFTCVIGPPPKSRVPLDEIWDELSNNIVTLNASDMIQSLLDDGISPSAAARCVTKATSLPRKKVYKLALELSKSLGLGQEDCEEEERKAKGLR
uniref:Tetrapyrrole methylase domain-containing protein n=1 Tax=Compsopogon caeruleus TaxID=31354 RepID=A0A7S1TH62_9RHOD